MTLDVFEWTGSQGFRYVKALAVLSKKDGADRRYQKTWKVRTVAPAFAVVEMRPSFEAQAKRWADKMLNP